ncbi:hypothetical protein HaLaN_31663, partial [Haematococcus lacustris]
GSEAGCGTSNSSPEYWIDFQVLSSPLSTTLLERALRAVGQVVSIVPGLLSVSRKTSL